MNRREYESVPRSGSVALVEESLTEEALAEEASVESASVKETSVERASVEGVSVEVASIEGDRSEEQVEACSIHTVAVKMYLVSNQITCPMSTRTLETYGLISSTLHVACGTWHVEFMNQSSRHPPEHLVVQPKR